MMAEAKISGSTPLALIFSGMWVDWPPYILRPTTRLAYCTGTRRSPRSMKVTPTIKIRKTMMMPRKLPSWNWEISTNSV